MSQAGFNVVGYISANLGLGVAARTTVRILQENRFPVSVVEVDAGFGRSGSDRSFDCLKNPDGSRAQYGINIIHLNPPELEALLCREKPSWLLDKNKLNAIVPFWELPVVPRSWIVTLQRMDLILAPTHFIEYAMATQVSGVQVRHYPQITFIPDSVKPDRTAFGLPHDKVLFVTSFEMLSDINRKNVWAVIDAFCAAFHDGDNTAALVVKVNNPAVCAVFLPQIEKLRAIAAQNSSILLWEKTLSYEGVLSLYSSCDVLVSLHRSEGFGFSPLEAMMIGKPVIATAWSGNMDFMNDANSCLVPYTLVSIPETSSSSYNVKYVGRSTVWAEPDIQSAIAWMRLLASDPGVRSHIGGAAAASMRQRHAAYCKGDIFKFVEQFHENRSSATAFCSGGVAAAGVRRPRRVLFLNRANAFGMPGGDTIIMKRLIEWFERRGVSVDFSSDTTVPNIRKYDILHLFNLTLPSVTEKFACQAVINNVPFVVTTLQEDFCRYFHKAAAAYSWFKEFVEASEGSRASPPPLALVLDEAKPVRLITSHFAGAAANLLCACGETEAGLLRAIFRHDRIAVVRFGSEVKDISAPAALFEEKFNVGNFVLCVGRVEARKNQLMLLLALQESDIPVVFADGGFTYQPAYLDLCKRFKRSGPTVFTGRLSDELLVSAYHACSLHCLPSWYELPGLVSLEAALYGCNVVASSWGCLPDYLPQSCVWCSPDDPESIRSAVEAAISKPRNRAASEAASAFTWEKFGEEMMRQYERVLQEHNGFPPEITELASRSTAAMELPDFLERITCFVEKGQIKEAVDFYNGHRKLLPESSIELNRVDKIIDNMRKTLQINKPVLP